MDQRRPAATVRSPASMISRQGPDQQRGHRLSIAACSRRPVASTPCDRRPSESEASRVDYAAVLYSADGGRPTPPHRCSGQQLCFVSAPSPSTRYETAGAGRCGPSRYRQTGRCLLRREQGRRSISDRSHDETDLWSPSRALGQQANGQWPITGRSNDGQFA